ncbi:LPXTG cell wall anchor domain-containing protein, partial [Streptococcus suis]
AVEAEMMAKIEAATTPSSSSTEPSTSTEPSSSGTETSTSTSQSTSDSNTGGATDTSSSSGTVVPSDKKVTPTNKKGKSNLPSTGEQVSILLVALGVAGILTAIFLHRKKSSKE